MISNFPKITANITVEFIKQHVLAAKCHRRTDTGNSFGVTAAQIRDHLQNSIPSLKEYSVSLSTAIHKLFQVPNGHFQ